MSGPIKYFEDPCGYWNDEAGRRWVARQDDLDTFMAPITARLLLSAAPMPGESIVDIGCGCGDTTVALAQAVGTEGSVLGVDVSEPMLARAKQRTAAQSQVELALADATTYEFAPGSVDLLTSRFGVMFFLDPLAAFTNIRKCLKPGGRLCFAIWQSREENLWMSGAQRALPEMPAPELGADDAPGPFSLADSSRTGQILDGAGFSEISFDSFNTVLSVGDTPEQALEFYNQVGPLSRYLETLEPAERDASEARVLTYLKSNWGTAALPMDASCWMLRARA